VVGFVVTGVIGGRLVGFEVGLLVGERLVGGKVGSFVGAIVVGCTVGTDVGLSDGLEVGGSVGLLDGSAVTGLATGLDVVGVGTSAQAPNVFVSSRRKAPPVMAETPFMTTSYEPNPHAQHSPSPKVSVIRKS